MRRVLLFLVLAALAGACQKGREESLNLPPLNPEGFRGIGWGASLDELTGLIPLAAGEAGGESFFRREKDELNLDGVAVERILYRFAGGRFVQGLIFLEQGQAAVQSAKRTLFDQYGPMGPFVGQPSDVPGLDRVDLVYRWTLASGSISLLVARDDRQAVLVYAGTEKATGDKDMDAGEPGSAPESRSTAKDG